jgi:Mg-chelatase subunit ChlD
MDSPESFQSKVTDDRRDGWSGRLLHGPALGPVLALPVLALLALGLAAVGVSFTPPRSSLAAGAVGGDGGAPRTALALADQLYLSEVSPAADASHPAWVELTVGRVDLDPQRVFTPLVLFAAQAPAQAGERAPTGSSVIAGTPRAGLIGISHWKVSDMDGGDYTFPDSLPDLPQGTRLLLLFDGQGSAQDDLDPADGLVTLHTPAGLTDPFEAAGDQLALYDDQGALVDFVAWGQDPGADDDAAAAAGLWTDGAYLVYDPGFGAGVESAPDTPGESFGIWYSALADGYRNWLPYAAGDSSPGALNTPPRPLHSTLPDGAEISAETFGLSWSGVPGASAYQIEMSTDLNFSHYITDALTTQTSWQPGAILPDGPYFWRVRAVSKNGLASRYLGPYQVSLQSLGQFVTIVPPVELLDPSEYKIQHKDTPLLDIGGGPNNIVGANNAGDRRFPVDMRWDGEHVDGNGDPRFGWNGIDNWYCVRASTAMLADYYGGSLSQDRISYYVFEEWAGGGAPLLGVPEHDLGFGTGIGSYDSQNQVISWALGTTVTGISYCPPDPNDGKPYSCPDPNAAPITWLQIKTWIDAGRPFASVNLRNAHMRVVDGYWEISATSRWVHVIDPVPGDTSACPTCTGQRWESYQTFADTHERAYVGPAGRNGAPSVRSDEASIWKDSDGDGISDFDEINRFHTDPYNPDTDGDWVNDKADLAEYIFDDSATVGTYIYTPGMKPDTSDYDQDGLRKELDWDNDNDGAPDGCEDANGNGIFDSGSETSNFNASAHQICQPRFAIRDPVHGQAANAGDPSNPGKVLIRLEMALPPALPNKPTFTAGQFKARIGGLDAPTISGLQVGQEFWLLVQAPAQASSSFFDLEVDFDGTPTGHADQSDTEANAVYYVPRPPMDTVVVLDTSASMGLSNKLEDAKNAARLYIDQWEAGDMLGLVTFNNSAHLVSQLTTVAPSLQVLTNTKNLLNGLTANGQTAMGSGLKLGQNQLATRGDSAHDQSLMLLTDGQENVQPYWADPSVSGVIIPSSTVVNTIGFGPPNSVWFGLLQQVAGATGGVFGAVDDSGALVSSFDPEGRIKEGLQAFPVSTANRLADAYKYAAEQILGEQRLYEATGTLVRTVPSAAYKFTVDNLASLVVSANFDVPNLVGMQVYDPSGTEILPGDAGVSYRHDQTHVQFRIGTPLPGVWEVKLSNSAPLVVPVEYILFAGGSSPLTMDLVVGAVDSKQAPVVALLADHAPVLGATVTGQVQTAVGLTPLTLLDDGEHGDGAAGDGAYGAYLTVSQVGAYLIKVQASGMDNNDNSFMRFAQATLNYCPFPERCLP